MVAKIKIENVVASATLGVEKIPLERAASELEGTEYNPEQFPGVILRLDEPKISALLFSSGKIVCTGAKSKQMILDAIHAIEKKLETIGVKKFKEAEMEIQNIVASGELGMSLNLTELAFELETSEYEPEQFPGLVYKMPFSHITFLLFSTGKIVCTGAKNKKEIEDAVEELIKTLKELQENK